MNGPQAASGERDQLAQDFVQFAIESGVLRFGEFKTKAGRMSPYFFNAGLFDDGAKLGRLAQFYARALLPRASSSTYSSARPTRAFRWARRWRWNWRAWA